MYIDFVCYNKYCICKKMGYHKQMKIYKGLGYPNLSCWSSSQWSAGSTTLAIQINPDLVLLQQIPTLEGVLCICPSSLVYLYSSRVFVHLRICIFPLALMPCMVRLLLRGVHSICPGSQVYLYSSRSWGHIDLIFDCWSNLNLLK